VLCSSDGIAIGRVHHHDAAARCCGNIDIVDAGAGAADHLNALSLMMALARQIPEANASTHAGKWERNRFMGVELFNKTLGIIGCGNIGSIVADRALGLKMKVIAYDPFLSPERASEIGVEKVDLDDIFRRADFITLHAPLTDKTRNIIDAGAIAKMKK
jgi:D-3-phosphoglycerate dehydrogenase / 2-oxoglutarate reductase